jgi:hypothetical protein
MGHPGATLLFADVPGTNEVPQFIAEAACQQALTGIRVLIGLQLPRSEQSRIDALLASAGSDQDRARLVEGEFWRRPNQDGRSSKAIVDLIDFVRELKARNRPIEVFAYEEPGVPGPELDAPMARNVLSWREKARDALILVLAPGAHPRLVPNPNGPTMALRLVQAERWLTSLVASHAGGTAWNCLVPAPNQVQCGLHSMAARLYPPAPRRHPTHPRDEVRFMARWPRTSREGYQGTYYLGALTASPPAIEKPVKLSFRIAGER